MLIRFVVENLFSFGDRKEFTTIPNTKLKTLKHHCYKECNFDVLKMTSLYGANGAGKSNLIKSLELFQKLIIREKSPYSLRESKFKFNKDGIPQIMAVEFIQDNIPFYYALAIDDNIVSTEELYISGLGKDNDSLLFERKTDKKTNKSYITFLDEFENDEKSQILKSILLDEFVKPTEPILKLLSNRDNKFLKNIKLAYKWFNNTLQIITPNSKPRALAHIIDVSNSFREYAKDLMCSFNIGITDLKTNRIKLMDFFGEGDDDEVNEIIKKFEDSPDSIIGFRKGSDEIVIAKEDDEIWVKSLKIGHSCNSDSQVYFDLDEESDGTIRLLDFTPAFKSIISEKKVFVIDEIERSIHPLLIKELVQKFSLDEKTKGQLFFTTHESNLLDQRIFRQDEIWFAEKSFDGTTDLYSLNDFKEHKTIDIRKGYLNGRYGSIPFLGNLKDLNWDKYDFNK